MIHANAMATANSIYKLMNDSVRRFCFGRLMNELFVAINTHARTSSRQRSPHICCHCYARICNNFASWTFIVIMGIIGCRHSVHKLIFLRIFFHCFGRNVDNFRCSFDFIAPQKWKTGKFRYFRFEFTEMLKWRETRKNWNSLNNLEIDVPVSLRADSFPAVFSIRYRKSNRNDEQRQLRSTVRMPFGLLHDFTCITAWTECAHRMQAHKIDKNGVVSSCDQQNHLCACHGAAATVHLPDESQFARLRWITLLQFPFTEQLSAQTASQQRRTFNTRGSTNLLEFKNF